MINDVSGQNSLSQTELRIRQKNLNRKIEIAFFLTLWFAFGAAINSQNLKSFNLQQIGVEAIVERGVFYLENSRTPEMQLGGDVFAFENHKYAAKQPGQFFLGAWIYSYLHLLGFTYSNNYLLVSALVTFFTGSFLTAVCAIILFRLSRKICGENSLFHPITVAASYGLASTAFAYSGIAHHDALATAFLLAAFYCVFSITASKSEKTKSYAHAAGLFLGFTITTSMLPFFMAVVVAIYFLFQRKRKLIPFFAIGGIFGIAPLLIYDWMSFGNPFLLPNVAGNYSDTFFRWDFYNVVDKIRFYAKMSAFYSPTFLLGLIGLAFLPQRFLKAKVFAFGVIFVLLLYLLNIGTVGDCQYGPRYLLPAMPFACLGIAGFSRFTNQTAKFAAIFLILITALFSFAVNLTGALKSAMFCNLSEWAFYQYLTNLQFGEAISYPLSQTLAVPLAASALWLLIFIYQQYKTNRIER